MRKTEKIARKGLVMHQHLIQGVAFVSKTARTLVAPGPLDDCLNFGPWP